MSTPPRILVAGIGNIFLGDDAFGVEVVQRLGCRAWPVNVSVVDFGIRGLDLTYALLDGYDAVVLVDAAPRGQSPGTLSVIEPELADCAAGGSGEVTLDAHAMNPVKVLQLVRAMGGEVRRLLLVACEPQPLAVGDDEEMSMGLSPRVGAAVDQAVLLIESLVARLAGESVVGRPEACPRIACTNYPSP